MIWDVHYKNYHNTVLTDNQYKDICIVNFIWGDIELSDRWGICKLASANSIIIVTE